jgi:predicted amino acid racemase
MATAKLTLGQTLRGRIGLYTITKQLQDCVWLAKYALRFTLESVAAVFISNKSQKPKQGDCRDQEY